MARNAAEEIQLNNALLRFYYKENPEDWDDDTYYKRLCEMRFVFEHMGLKNYNPLNK